MKIRLKPKRKTWVALFKEAHACKNKETAKEWLEREALILKKRNPGFTLAGSKFIIRMNLGALAPKYGSESIKIIKRLFGVVSPIYGKYETV